MNQLVSLSEQRTPSWPPPPIIDQDSLSTDHVSACSNPNMIPNHPHNGPAHEHEKWSSLQSSSDSQKPFVSVEHAPPETPSISISAHVTLAFIKAPFLYIWRRLQWGLILSIGKRNSFAMLHQSEMKNAVATALEITIMGSALILTLCLQLQEVVGSRGGFSSDDNRSIARYIFVSSSAFSFGLAFYSVVTSAVMLLLLSSIPAKYVPFKATFCQLSLNRTSITNLSPLPFPFLCLQFCLVAFQKIYWLTFPAGYTHLGFVLLPEHFPSV